MLTLLVLSLAGLVYIYVGYPLLLRLAVAVRGERKVRKGDITPKVSLVISAFNEAGVIRRKLENALSLDYPPGLLEVVVVSDASDDGTDAIVLDYAARGVKLARQELRRGKTAGLNRVVPTLAGDLVVFSDANAMYEPDALRALARNFADPDVGCVTGEARYTVGNQAAADVGERVYWGYEIQIKRFETALGSMVGGDGAIYAIRKPLWQSLPEDAINDFLNPLQIVSAGWRAVYEPAAVCYEETAGAVKSEYRRRVRIVSRSWRAVFQARAVLNPFKHGLFTWSVISHKVLRWFSGVLVASAAVAVIVLALRLAAYRPFLAGAVGISVALVITAVPSLRRLAAMLSYFVAINTASLVGMFKGSLGKVSGVWTTPRQPGELSVASHGRMVPVGTIFLGLAAVGIVLMALALGFAAPERVAEVTFWTAISMLAYVYAGYPLLLAALRHVADKPVYSAAIEPTVCLFITANDEEAVIEAKLNNALALDYPADRLQVIVASDGSVDNTNKVTKSFAPRVRLLEFSPRRGKIAAINEGVRAVTTDIVVFSDANTFLAPDALRVLVKHFADANVGAVSGDVALVGERAALARSEDLYYAYERWIQGAESAIGSMIGTDGALYAIRRVLFAAPANDTILDDMAIPMAVIRSGYRVVFESGAKAFEHGTESAKEEFSRKSRVVAGAMQFLRRTDSSVPIDQPQVILSLISHKALRWLSPALGTCTLFASAMLADSSHGYAAAVVAQAALLILGLAGCWPALRRHSIIAMAHYFCLVQTAAMVGFMRGLFGRQSVMWRRELRATADEAQGVLP